MISLNHTNYKSALNQTKTNFILSCADGINTIGLGLRIFKYVFKHLYCSCNCFVYIKQASTVYNYKNIWSMFYKNGSRQGVCKTHSPIRTHGTFPLNDRNEKLAIPPSDSKNSQLDYKNELIDYSMTSQVNFSQFMEKLQRVVTHSMHSSLPVLTFGYSNWGKLGNTIDGNKRPIEEKEKKNESHKIRFASSSKQAATVLLLVSKIVLCWMSELTAHSFS